MRCPNCAHDPNDQVSHQTHCWGCNRPLPPRVVDQVELFDPSTARAIRFHDEKCAARFLRKRANEVSGLRR